MKEFNKVWLCIIKLTKLLAAMVFMVMAVISLAYLISPCSTQSKIDKALGFGGFYCELKKINLGNKKGE